MSANYLTQNKGEDVPEEAYWAVKERVIAEDDRLTIDTNVYYFKELWDAISYFSNVRYGELRAYHRSGNLLLMSRKLDPIEDTTYQVHDAFFQIICGVLEFNAKLIEGLLDDIETTGGVFYEQ